MNARLPDNRAVGGIALTSSVAAVACGACCVLPLAIPAAMLGTFGGLMAWFAQAYGVLTPLAIVSVSAGWLWIALQSRRSHKRASRSTLIVMGFATLMATLAYLWPLFERAIAAC